MDKLDGKYWTVRLYNGTGTYASVAVSYVALDGLQETSGWTTFQQGQWSENLQDPGAQHGGVENGGFHDSLLLEGSVSG